MQHITSAENHAEFSQAVNSGLQLQGLALLCTAIVETFKRQLTLFHAICLMHLLSLLGFGLAAQGGYEGRGGFGLRRWLVLAGARVAIGCAFFALTLYIWLTAPTFGSQPECNAGTLYAVFGVRVHATSDVFRYVILAFMAMMSIAWIINILFSAMLARYCCGGGRGRRGAVGGREVALAEGVMRRMRISDPRHKGNAVKQQIIELMIHTGVNIYMIVTLEQTVSMNRLDAAEKEWTFGQILALFVLLGVVVEVANILLSKLDEDEDDTELLPGGPGGDVELQQEKMGGQDGGPDGGTQSEMVQTGESISPARDVAPIPPLFPSNSSYRGPDDSPDEGPGGGAQSEEVEAGESTSPAPRMVTIPPLPPLQSRTYRGRPFDPIQVSLLDPAFRK